MLVTKDSLANSMKLLANRKTLEGVCEDGFILPWFPLSYNLTNSSELAEFLLTNIFFGKFAGSVKLSGECAEEENIWIIKRFNGKQSIDYPITSSIGCAIRHLESSPRLASRYVTNPVLYGDKKFDLRYFVAVKSLQPLVMARHTQYVVRVANDPFAKEDFESYQKHFTVMNFIGKHLDL